jgi:hypothetical protein
MQKRVHSRLALRTLLKFRSCAEGWIAREWTCWKPLSKTLDGNASGRPPTIQRTLHNTTCGRTVARCDLMPFLTSGW